MNKPSEKTYSTTLLYVAVFENYFISSLLGISSLLPSIDYIQLSGTILRECLKRTWPLPRSRLTLNQQIMSKTEEVTS